jgi:zona occludens toxin
MIILVTGVPGAGKTLYALNLVKARAEKENRTVYQNGVAECTLPWELLSDAEKWPELVPDGSMLLIDEAQRVFRPRGTGAAVPSYVSALETHRHKGLDIFLVTQHPMLVDSNIRRLVGQHFHVVRRFGTQFATVHEWSSCTDLSKSAVDDSIRHEFRYPSGSFSWYKSAEVHTHKRNVPFRMWFLLASPFIVGGLAWVSVGQMEKFTEKKKSAELAKAAIGAGGEPRAGPGSPVNREEYVRQFAPRVKGLAYTAPVYDKVTEIARAPVPVGCVASSSRCGCYSQDGTRLDVEEQLCREIVVRGFFVPFEVKNPVQAQQQTPASGGGQPGQPGLAGGGRAAPAPVPSAVPVQPVPVSAPTGSASPSGAVGARGGVKAQPAGGRS